MLIVKKKIIEKRLYLLISIYIYICNFLFAISNYFKERPQISYSLIPQHKYNAMTVFSKKVRFCF